MKRLKKLTAAIIAGALIFSTCAVSAAGLIESFNLFDGQMTSNMLGLKIEDGLIKEKRFPVLNGTNGGVTYAAIQKKLAEPLPTTGKLVFSASVRGADGSFVTSNTMLGLYSGSTKVSSATFYQWESNNRISSNALADKKIFSAVKYGMHLATAAADDIITVDYTANRTYITAQRPGATYVADVYYDDTGAELSAAPAGATPGLPIAVTGGVTPGAVDTVTISNFHQSNLGETLWATMDIAFDYAKLVHIAEDNTETVIFHDTFDDPTKTVFDYGWQLARANGYITKEGDAIAFLKTNEQSYEPDFYVPMDEAVTSGKFSVSFYTKGESRTPTTTAAASEQVLVAFADKSNKKEVYSVTLPAAEKTEYVLVGDTADGSAALYKKTADGYEAVEGAPTTLTAEGGVYKFDAIRMKPAFASNPQTRGAVVVSCGSFDIANEPLTVTACSADTAEVRTDAAVTIALSSEIDAVPEGAVTTTLNGEEVPSEVTLEADNKTITVYYPYGLLYGTGYKLTADGITGKNLIGLERYELDFTTEEMPLYISSIKYTDAAGTEAQQGDAVKAAITIENGTGFEADYTAIVAAYDAGGMLTKVYTKAFTLPAGQSTTTVDIAGAAQLKTRVWKGIDELIPIY